MPDPAYAAKWKQRYSTLKHFKEVHGHCNVVSKDPANKQLSRWVENQRMFHKKKELSPQRVALLDELGFEWIRPHRSETKFSKKKTVAVPMVEDDQQEEGQGAPVDSSVPQVTEQILLESPSHQRGQGQGDVNGVTPQDMSEVDMSVSSPIELHAVAFV